MAGVKISQLNAIPSSLLTDIFPAVQSGTTFKTTLSQVVTLFNANITLSSVAQVTGLPAALASFVPLAGGTMTGPLILSGNPTMANQAANKAYVDTVGSGLTVILAAQAATTANLNATQAGAGIGATLTNAGAQAAFAVDGYSASLNDRILVKNQTATQHNGVYSVTTLGSGASNWVLTRTTDYDTSAQIKPGTLVAVNNGTVNANTSWLETATVTTVDTDPVLFSQFTFSPGQFLEVANNLSDVASASTSRTNLGLTGAAIMTLPVSPANGGTGVNNGTSTLTMGGNVVFSGAFSTTFTITAGTNVTFPTTGTLITSSQPTINQPVIVGVTNNSMAAAGQVGEVISSIVLSGAAVSLTTGTNRDITSIPLTAGEWIVWGNIAMIPAGTITGYSGWTSLSSATLPDPALRTRVFASGMTGETGEVIPMKPYFLSGATTVYLSCVATFTSTMTACGAIYALRVR